MTAPVVLITGASGGLGTTMTETFRGAGFRVAAVARSWKEASSEGLLLISADLMKPGGAAAAVTETVAKFAGIDALVHVAGGFAGGQRTEDTADEVWDQMLNLNLRAVVSTFRATIPVMRAAGRGRIVVVGSKSGTEASPMLSAYAASKAALHSLVQSAAAELKQDGVTVNAILPSVIDTPANRSAMGEKNVEKWVKPSSLASMALWLCSDGGQDVTGSLIPVYGRI